MNVHVRYYYNYCLFILGDVAFINGSSIQMRATFLI